MTRRPPDGPTAGAVAPNQDVCRHLGSVNGPGTRETFPSLSHRCHLWQQRDQIDLLHQRNFCLSEAHRRCPWLSVPPSGQRPADRTLPKRKLAVSGGVMASLAGVAALLLTGMPSLDGFSLGGQRQPLVAHAAAPAAVLAATDEPGSGSLAAAPIVLPVNALAPAILKETGPKTVTANLTSDSGGTVVAGNVGLSFSPASLAQAGGDVTVHVEAQPPANVPGGPAQFSPNGTIVDITVKDQTGKLVTTFPEPVDILFKYNGADLAMARGDSSIMTAAYVLDDDSPELENPLHFPSNTWLFFPPSVTKLDTDSGTVMVHTQAIGSIMSIVANRIGWGQTLKPNVPLYSSFDVRDAKVFGTKQQFSYLRIMEPQIGSRLLVMEPETGNYSYVDAKDLGPSGPPPGSNPTTGH